MSTNSIIAMTADDGSVTGIYCHWDGYIDGVGQTLYRYYRLSSRVKELLGLGFISSLGPELIPTDPSHNFDHPQKGVTVAYHRDRGDDFEQINAPNMEAFKKECAKYFSVEYVYMYDYPTGRWTVNGEPLWQFFPRANRLFIDTPEGCICCETDMATLDEALGYVQTLEYSDDILHVELCDADGNIIEEYDFK